MDSTLSFFLLLYIKQYVFLVLRSLALFHSNLIGSGYYNFSFLQQKVVTLVLLNLNGTPKGCMYI